MANGRRLPTNDIDPTITIIELIAEFWAHAKSWYVKNGKPTDEQAAYKVVLRYLKQEYGTQLVTEFGLRSLRAIC